MTNSLEACVIGATKSAPTLFRPRTLSSRRYAVTRPLLVLTLTMTFEAPGSSESIRILFSDEGFTVMGISRTGPFSE